MAASASKYTLITGLIREDLSLTFRPRTPGQMFSRRVSKQPRRVQSCGVPSCVVPLSVFTFIQSQCSETREKERGVKDGLSSSPAARIPHVTAVSHTSALQVLHRITKWKVGRDHRGSSGPTSLLSQALPRAHCTGLHPDSPRTPPVGEIPQPLWATCSSAQPPAQQSSSSSAWTTNKGKVIWTLVSM